VSYDGLWQVELGIQSEVVQHDWLETAVPQFRSYDSARTHNTTG